MDTAAFGFTMLLQIFLPCYYGSELSSASEKICTAIYRTDWVHKDIKFKSSTKIVMANGQEPLKICSWGFVNVDIELFNSICNATYSLYALFKKIT